MCWWGWWACSPVRLQATMLWPFGHLKKVGYVSSISGKVERPQQTIKNMVHIQLLSCFHVGDFWFFCYHYTICVVVSLINRHIFIPHIFAWYKHKNISYITPFSERFTWGYKIYVIKSNKVKEKLYPCTNTYLCTYPPDIDPYLLPPGEDAFFVEIRYFLCSHRLRHLLHSEQT